MIEGPEVEPHAHHRTGHSFLDLIFAALAVVLSCTSIFIAVHHGKTMEKLVEANSWPNLSIGTSNTDMAGDRDIISIDVKNTGVGPARIDSVEVFYDGKPRANAIDLLGACCGQHHDIATSAIEDEVLPARETIPLISVRKDLNSADFWAKLDEERLHVRLRICYCSVFDDCWVRESTAKRPVRVDQCAPSQPVEYH